MARNTSVLLSDHYQNFIDSKITAGEYASASEMVREGLRLLEVQDLKLQQLRAELEKGLNSGIVENFDPKSFLAELKDSRK